MPRRILSRRVPTTGDISALAHLSLARGLAVEGWDELCRVDDARAALGIDLPSKTEDAAVRARLRHTEALADEAMRRVQFVMADAPTFEPRRVRIAYQEVLTLVTAVIERLTVLCVETSGDPAQAGAAPEVRP